MYANQLEAYRTVQKTTMSGRQIEAAVLTKGAMLLKECQNAWGDNNLNAKLDEALKYNQKIWSVFQSELAKDDNPLPHEIRSNILSLSAFIDKRIFEVMAFPSSEKLDIIININLNLAAGLRNQPQ